MHGIGDSHHTARAHMRHSIQAQRWDGAGGLVCGVSVRGGGDGACAPGTPEEAPRPTYAATAVAPICEQAFLLQG